MWAVGRSYWDTCLKTSMSVIHTEMLHIHAYLTADGRSEYRYGWVWDLWLKTMQWPPKMHWSNRQRCTGSPLRAQWLKKSLQADRSDALDAGMTFQWMSRVIWGMLILSMRTIQQPCTWSDWLRNDWELGEKVKYIIGLILHQECSTGYWSVDEKLSLQVHGHTSPSRSAD